MFRLIKKKIADLFRRLLANQLAKHPQLSRPQAIIQVLGVMNRGDRVNFGEGCNVFVGPSSKLNVGDDVYIGRYVEIGSTANLLSIGNFSSIQDRCILLGDVQIGRYCTFAANVQISSGNHYFELEPHINIKDQDFIVASTPDLMAKHNKPTVVEDDCWIGTNTWIKSGIKIGKGSIIGAGSVVTKDLPPYSVAAGNPAKILKKRLVFDPPSHLSWDRPEDLPYFYSGFLVSQTERAALLAEGGIGTNHKFSVAIENTGKLGITTRNISGEGRTLHHAGYSFEIGETWTTISLKSPIRKENLFEFSVTGVHTGPEIGSFSGILIRQFSG